MHNTYYLNNNFYSVVDANMSLMPMPGHQVLSAATDFVKLEENVSDVTYIGAELLIEYTVRLPLC